MGRVIESCTVPEKGQYLGIAGVTYKVVDVSYIHGSGELTNIDLKLEKQCSGSDSYVG